MLKYLLDTNIISELITKQPNQNVLNFLSSINENDTYLSVITIGEIKTGIENVKNIDKKEKLCKWLEEDLLIRFKNRIVDIDLDIMITWGKINQNLKSVGKPLPIMDSIIASSCIYTKFTLITRNEKDFQNLDLNIINPFTY
ncbi:MAG: VapC toxin family PIN domain ribonuclease [Epsilonproteobacteria bacterium]|nr:MAG: VapC toxin family PIN domain ribonuclease [Campylobacterota bacterium]